MKKIINWLVYSSADPVKISLTLKSFVPFILAVGVWFKLDVAESDLNNVITAITDIIVGITGIVSAGGVIYGFGRKLFFAVKKEWDNE